MPRRAPPRWTSCWWTSELWRDACCPPFADPRWEDRFDFFGANSRLSAVIEVIKRDVAARIKQMFEALITPELKTIGAAFGVGNAALYDTTAAGPPSWAQVRPSNPRGPGHEGRPDRGGRLACEPPAGSSSRCVTGCGSDSIESYISTGNPDILNSGAGDGSQVFLRIMGAAGSIANVAPAPQGGGFPISTYNYNAGALAFEFFGSAHAFETPIPYRRRHHPSARRDRLPAGVQLYG